MFYQGDLQSGIAQAVRESKLVICFVRDQTPESSTWENEYFTDEEIAPIIESKSICLRIDAGSQEAGFLSSFCPITSTPAAFVIKNGLLTAYLSPGIPKDVFKSKLRAGLEGVQPTTASQSEPPPAEAAHVQESAPTNVPEVTATEMSSDNEPESSHQPPRSTPKTPKADKGKNKVEHISDSKPGRQDWIKQQQTVNQLAKAERTRILQQIKNDREEWKHKQQMRQGATPDPSPESSTQTPKTSNKTSQKPNSHSNPQNYRIQVRLLDGSTIRSSFTRDQTIGTDVRQWIDDSTGGNAPYTLKQLLTPLPNRTISVSEEEESLQSLALGPSATLIMVPIQSYTSAYVGAGPGLVSRGISGGVGLIQSGVGTVYGALSTFLGYGQGPPTTAGGPNAEDADTPARNDAGRSGRTYGGNGNINVRTLADQQRERGDHQFYNGNQLNFEPRPDDGDKRD